MKKLLLLLGFTLILFSCKKENITVKQQEIELSQFASESDAFSEQSYSHIFDDVLGQSDEVGLIGTGIFGREGWDKWNGLDTTPRCFTVRIDYPSSPQSFPRIITITFPQSGCMGPDGRIRRGQMKTVYTSRMMVPGAESVTTFLNYSVDSVTVGGIYRIKNIVDPVQLAIFPPQYNHKWLVKVEGGRLGYPNNSVVEWNSTKTVEQIEGSHTLLIRDDVFKKTGNSSGQLVRGLKTTSWSSEITEPLIKKYTCRWIVKGKIRTVRRNLSNTSPWIGILDFGNEMCDNQATLNVKGNIRTITLP